jgi:uncharacterized membrane protein
MNNPQLSSVVQERWQREVDEVTHPDVNKELPVGVRIFALLVLLYAIITTFGTFHTFFRWVFSNPTIDTSQGMSTTICQLVSVVSFALIAPCMVALSALLLLEKRRHAARFIYIIYALLGANFICHIMLTGIHKAIVLYLFGFAILIALQIYLDPTLRCERARERAEQDERWREEQAQGTLGFDKTGKGAIEINFFNLFWMFVFCSFVGLVAEEIYHFIFVVPGEWQDRAGLLIGPFSPIYGFGAVIMSVALNRLHKCPTIVIFLFAAVIGGVFEAFVGYFMQYAFGAVAWDYSNEVLPLFGGKTCAKFMIMWGFMGAVWLKILMPSVVKMINKIPWNFRYVLTLVATVLMLTNAALTLQALDCWYERVSIGEEAANKSNLTKFYATNFGDEYMQNRFESMTIMPDEAVRGDR